MIEHKLLDVLRTFNEIEFSEFDKFLRSPFHNDGRNYSGVLKGLKKYYPAFDNKNFTKENLFRESYPGEKFNGNKINIAFSRIYKGALEFMAFNSLKTNDFESNRLILTELNRRKLYSRFDKLLNETANLIKPNSDFSERYFEEKSLLYRIAAEKIFSAEEVYTRKIEIAKRTEYTLYSVINKIIMCRYDLSLFQNEFGSDYDSGFSGLFFKDVNIENILENLKTSGSVYYSILALKYYGLLLRTPCDENIYSKYKDLFYSQLENLSFSEKYVYFNNMAGFCIGKSNDGHKAYDDELMKIYREMLQHELFGHTPEEYFDLSHYRNMLLSALDINDLEFIDDLINKYSKRLNPQFRDDMINYSKAKLLFAKNQTDASLNYASKVKQDFFLFKPDIKILLLQLYFDSGFYEELFSLIDSFKHFISGSSDISDARKARYMNFLKHLSAITKLKIHFDDEKKTKIAKELESAHDIALKSWLLGKIQ